MGMILYFILWVILGVWALLTGPTKLAYAALWVFYLFEIIMSIYDKECNNTREYDEDYFDHFL